MPSSELRDAYERLCAHEAFGHSHVSIDRSARGEETLNVVPDWVEQSGIALAVALARELELELVLTKDGLRFAEHDNEFSQRVQSVKSTLAEDGEDA